MATALAALDGDDVRAQFHGLDRMLDRPDRRHADDTGVLQPLDRLGVRATPIAHRPHLVLDHHGDDLLGVRLEHVKVDAERLVGLCLDGKNFALHRSRRRGRTAIEAEAARIAGRGGQIGIGHPTHGGLNDGIGTTQSVAKLCMKTARHRFTFRLRHLFSMFHCLPDDPPGGNRHRLNELNMHPLSRRRVRH